VRLLGTDVTVSSAQHPAGFHTTEGPKQKWASAGSKAYEPLRQTSDRAIEEHFTFGRNETDAALVSVGDRCVLYGLVNVRNIADDVTSVSIVKRTSEYECQFRAAVAVLIAGADRFTSKTGSGIW